MLAKCERCGVEFRAKPRDKRRYCSSNCYHGATRDVDKAERTQLECKTCGAAFWRAPGELKSYVAKFGRPPLYCSIPCSAIGRRADTQKRNTFICKECGKEAPMKHHILTTTGRSQYHLKQVFCDRACKAANHRRVAAERFTRGEIGRHVKRHGYVWISIPANLTGTGKKREMLEHRYVMEQALGRPLLPTETVHHKNGQKADNRLSNLDLRSGNHGPGGDVSAMIVWAHAFIAAYPQFDAEGNLHPVDGGDLAH